MDRVTFATSSGFVWLALAVHFAAGLVSIVAGAIALSVAKGGRGSVILLAAIGDLRAIRAGGLQGPRRLARHLWRMCFAFFIATGSFFLGQMKFIPEAVRVVPMLLVLGFAPILLLFYWLWRACAFEAARVGQEVS